MSLALLSLGVQQDRWEVEMALAQSEEPLCDRLWKYMELYQGAMGKMLLSCVGQF